MRLLLHDRQARDALLAQIMELEPGGKFAWSGKTMLGMRDYHSFEMRPITANSCTLIQQDLSRGGVAPLIGKMVQNNNLKDYIEFNGQIKARAESTWQQKSGAQS